MTLTSLPKEAGFSGTTLSLAQREAYCEYTRFRGTDVLAGLHTARSLEMSVVDLYLQRYEQTIA